MTSILNRPVIWKFGRHKIKQNLSDKSNLHTPYLKKLFARMFKIKFKITITITMNLIFNYSLELKFFLRIQKENHFYANHFVVVFMTLQVSNVNEIVFINHVH